MSSIETPEPDLKPDAVEGSERQRPKIEALLQLRAALLTPNEPTDLEKRIRRRQRPTRAAE